MSNRQENLTEEWGAERMVKAMGDLSQFYLDENNGTGAFGTAQLMRLHKINPDALELFGARMLDKTDVVN